MQPRYGVWARPRGGLEVSFSSADPSKVVLEALRLREAGLVEGVHFTVCASKGGVWHVRIRIASLIRVAWLSDHGSGRQRELAAALVEHVLRSAAERGGEVYERVVEIVEAGVAKGSLRLAGLVSEVRVGGRRCIVKVFGCSAAVGASGLLHIAVSAEVGGVFSTYVFSFGRWFGNPAIRGFAYADRHAPRGREADAERLVALVAALTGKRPKVSRSKRGKIAAMLSREHLYRLVRYAELAEAVETWLTTAYSSP